MFEFLFKRPGDKSSSGAKAKPADPAAPGANSATPAKTSPAARAGDSARAVESANAVGAAKAAGAAAREAQAQRMAGLRGDESGAADFILQCDFSELRLAAAEHIHSREQLERVYTGIRNTDRRVAKLMQSRLDALRHHDAELQRGQACIDQATQLVSDDKLTPNQVADLDRKWSVVKAPELAGVFDELRARLGQRLERQVMLQRAMIDRLGQVRKLAASALSAAEIAAELQQLAQAQQEALAAPEHPSLPRSLTNEFANEHARVAAMLADIEQGQAAAARREAVLAEWQAAPAGSLNAEQMHKTWRQLPAAPEALADTLRQRFEQLLTTIPAPAPAADAPARTEPRKKGQAQAPDPAFISKLEAMEAALQHGSLGAAADMDKALKDSRGVRLTPALSERLVHARAELKRLSDWARWGGNVSREELIKAVETLSTQALSMSELAKKVGSMRDRWKSLDTLSGAAPKTLWERFDQACTAAYAPAAAHFKHLAEERHSNAAKAEALIAEAAGEAERIAGSATVDWKQMAATVQRLRLAWSHLGAIDRKDKKRLDQAFADALNVLQAPLEEQRKDEVSGREEMIAQVTALNPQDRHALDTLKALQERWQEHARAVPLERKTEQALWQRFRAACDAVFARRKEHAHAADAERRAHQEAKEALCARLEEAAATATAATAARLLRDAAAEWHAIGPVPRASEAKVEKRYQAAVAAIGEHAEAAKRDASRAQASALRDKLALCQQMEAQLAAPAGSGSGSDWTARWSALPAVSGEYERVLKTRFDAALAALEAQPEQRREYAARLEQNRPALLEEVLRLEIAAGIDSGAEFARDRLKLQVQSLQSSLKSGQKPDTAATRFLELCALPALADERTISRIDHLFARIAKDGK
ncbi:DUF349 domain-containing protein [Massilia sp. PAMC28688]|uniref:DUF349 domain-containing protein n=1 Tax=Massilia sp. PAMC28688 TaxID=2861283 RepID=UPI001C6261F7|nr:DUF349 domain-containing protein [Massilia sp. PAMC28688]QYF92544.1 DUF349 domain-containing protein [Massilia sp. PAMC28688]